MDYKNLTSPCGRDCFNCPFYLASNDERYQKALAAKLGLDPEKVVCNGCRNEKGNCQVMKIFGFEGRCKIYHCAASKNAEFCTDCNDFPCELLHPLAHGADKFPHNLKVFNLCMIRKMGLENWAKSKASQSSERYYNDKLDTCI